MKAAYINRYGGPWVLQVGDLPRPVPGPDDLLVRVHAASVNPVDHKIRAGLLKPLLHFDFPLTLGNDVAGVVEAVGDAVSGFGVGDRVFARLDKQRIGAFAEYALVSAGNAAGMPRALDFDEAAALPLVSLTSWQALVDLAHVKAGDRLLIHGGAGGVGSVAIQIAKHLGAWVASTASAANRDWLTELGADLVVDYRTERFEALVGECDAVFDTQGGAVLERSFAVVRRGGVVVTIGGVPNAAWARQRHLNAFTRLALGWMTRRAQRQARRRGVRYEYLFVEPDGKGLAQIAALVDGGVLRPVIDRVYPFERVAEAIAQVEAGHVRGKVVVHVD